MSMGYDDNWSNLPPELLIVIVQKISFLDDYFKFSAVCKSWRESVAKSDKPWLPTSSCPLLLLAEEFATGAIFSDGEYDSNQDYGNTTSEDEEDTDDDEEEEDEEDNDDYDDERYDHLRNSVGSSRGLYSLSTGNTYNIDLPEAAGRLIFGVNKGWLITLGRDLQINLLHPLLRHQIPLPSMLTFPYEYYYHENYTPEQDSEKFIRKAAVSSRLHKKNTVSLHHHGTIPSLIVMTIYGDCGFLGFAKLGDNVWTNVNVPSRSFRDIVYHKGNFYAVDCHGDVYVCGTGDDEDRGGPRGTKIASLVTNDCDQKYLVESLTGSGLLLIVRYRKEKYFKFSLHRRPKYRTTYFSVWRLDLKYSDSLENISCTLTKENDLGKEAIFVGRASSVAVSSSEIIKPNCIYFTDDNWCAYLYRGGGHDMGIFNMEHRTIEPHFQGKSLHPISPPLWYF